PVMRHRATRIARIELFHTLTAKPACKIGIGNHNRTVFLGDSYRIAHMVAMSVGQRNMSYALSHILEIDALCTGISVQKRIDENNSLCRFNAESGVAKPC